MPNSHLRVVRVVDTPTHLLLRADDYLAELQRELNLVRLGAREPGQARDAASILGSISAILEGCCEVRASLRSAAERSAKAGAPTFEAQLRVSDASRTTAIRLLELLNQARDFAAEGRILTLPASEDVAQFLCDWLEVVIAQLQGDVPSPPTFGTEVTEAPRVEAPLPPTQEVAQDEPVGADGTFRARLEPTLSASRRARDLLRRVEGTLAEPELCEAAKLPLSELVTNAVLHARTDIEVAVCFLDEALRVEVRDERPELHAPHSRDPESSTGRGLELVGAVADRWGVVRRPAGKTVWFELDGPRIAPH